MRSTYAEINLSNLIHNYESIAKKVGKETLVMPVVKADAYGHGMIECTKALLHAKPKPKFFAVALFEEAIEFRKKFKNERILVFGKCNSDDFRFIKKLNITPTIFDFQTLESLARFAERHNFKAKIHIKIETGMGRVGVDINDLPEYLDFIKKNKSIEVEGIYTHFATSDHRDKTFVKEQLKKFNQAIEIAKSKIKGIKYFHAANSGAILDIPESYFNMVRPGISLYGYYPSDETSESIQLKPVMSIKSKIAFIKWVEKNTSISYGRTYFTSERTQIGTLPIGYADGYNRLLSNKGKVILNNKFYNIAGRVTMDQIMVDFGEDFINLDDEVIVLGSSESLKFDANDIAKLIGTIPYEVCTSISKRVKRRFIY